MQLHFKEILVYLFFTIYIEYLCVDKTRSLPISVVVFNSKASNSSSEQNYIIA